MPNDDDERVLRPDICGAVESAEHRNRSGAPHSRQCTFSTEHNHASDPALRTHSWERDEPRPDMVNHPPHYRGPTHSVCGQPIEVIDLVEEDGFIIGNTKKYLMRAGKKGGPDKLVEDLKKARWYLDREIQRLSGRTDGKA